MSKNEMSDRNMVIYRLRKIDKKRLRVIGEQYSLTRQRVKQIVDSIDKKIQKA